MPAPPSSPIPAAVHRPDAPAALAPDQCRDLLDYLAQLTDPRHRRGRRHALTTVLAVAAAAVLARGGRLVIEHARRAVAAPMVGELALTRTLTAGDSVLSFYRLTSGAPA